MASCWLQDPWCILYITVVFCSEMLTFKDIPNAFQLPVGVAIIIKWLKYTDNLSVDISVAAESACGIKPYHHDDSASLQVLISHSVIYSSNIALLVLHLHSLECPATLYSIQVALLKVLELWVATPLKNFKKSPS